MKNNNQQPSTPIIDTPSEFIGKSSTFNPSSKALKIKYTNEILELYNQQLLPDMSDASFVASRLWEGESFESIKKEYKNAANKPKLPPEQQLLRDIADLQQKIEPNHHSVGGITPEGLFGGLNEKLNIDKNGNVVLTRIAMYEDHLTKGWVDVGKQELLDTTLSHGGGRGLPTSGISKWSDQFGSGYNGPERAVGSFVIPQKDFLQGIKDSNVYLGNLGEGEFVLNPKWAKDYLKTINGKDYKTSITTNPTLTVDPQDIKIDTHQGLDNNKPSGVDTKQTNKTQHERTHIDLKENSIKNFFGNKLKSFDTETTGLDYKNKDIGQRDRIWQVGLAIDGASGVEEHTSPFFVTKNQLSLIPTPKMDQATLEDTLKNMTGRFSQQAFEEGNFNEFIKQYNNGNLSDLNRSLKSTLGLIESSDVVVLQNMNFENNMLRSSLEQGLISEDLYESIGSRMQTTSIKRDGSLDTLFQRPYKVQRRMREADLIYNTRYLKDFSEDSFQTYRTHLNKAIAEYSTTINDTTRVGAVAVELQDITKAVLANAADKGYIDKQTATLGLNVDFLSKSILGYSESHTALQDSKDTISLFKTLWSMNEELESGAEISETTKKHLYNIKQNQSEEVNKKFMKTVNSVLNDFDTQSFTRITNQDSWYSPELTLKSQISEDDFNLHNLEEKSIGRGIKERDLPRALDTIYSRYSGYSENILDFNRFRYLEDIKEEFNNGVDVGTIKKRVEEDTFNYKPDTSKYNANSGLMSENQVNTNNIKPTNSFWDQKTTLFDKEMKVKTKATILGSIGAGLAYMAMTPTPPPQDYNDNNVTQQFYNEQYLGTAFVDFNERNKHYMM